MRFYTHSLFICLTLSNLTLFAQAKKYRISRIEDSDTSAYHFAYDAQGRLSQYAYDSESEDEHDVFQYFYNQKSRISHITRSSKGVLLYVCSYIYSNDTLTKRRAAFFERKFVRDEVFHYNEKGKIDKINYQQSDGDSIVMRFEYNDLGYPFRRVRLSNDFEKNRFAEITWDSTRRAISPWDMLFEGYPMVNVFERPVGTLPDYPIEHPIKHYISRTRDELGKLLNTVELTYSNIKTNEQDLITEILLTIQYNGKVSYHHQKYFYEN